MQSRFRIIVSVLMAVVFFSAYNIGFHNGSIACRNTHASMLATRPPVTPQAATNEEHRVKFLGLVSEIERAAFRTGAEWVMWMRENTTTSDDVRRKKAEEMWHANVDNPHAELINMYSK